MDHDERRTPDSLIGKLQDLFDADAEEEAEGTGTLARDAGRGATDAADDPAAQQPKRPTDPPF